VRTCARLETMKEQTKETNERKNGYREKKLKGKTEECTCRYLFIKEDNEIKVFKSAELCLANEKDSKMKQNKQKILSSYCRFIRPFAQLR
jgi:hypothetical protein